MLGDIVGYVTIKKDATTGRGAEQSVIDELKGADCRVIEFSADGSALVINAKSTALCSFDKEDLYRSFKCIVFGDVVCPPDTDAVNQILYSARVHARKGGYNDILRRMVITHSLMKGEFTDFILWAKQ